MTRTVSLLGSTGSIGTQALDVIERHADRFDVVALAAGVALMTAIVLVLKSRDRKLATVDAVATV